VEDEEGDDGMETGAEAAERREASVDLWGEVEGDAEEGDWSDQSDAVGKEDRRAGLNPLDT